MYKIKDLQTGDYFSGGEVFKSKKEACERLIDYHSNDCDMSIEREVLSKGKIKKCWEAVAQFEWELEKITGLTLKNFMNKMKAKARKKGFYENFGQKEINDLKDKYGYEPYGGTDKEQGIAERIDALQVWVEDLSLEDLN